MKLWLVAKERYGGLAKKVTNGNLQFIIETKEADVHIVQDEKNNNFFGRIIQISHIINKMSCFVLLTMS